ncbi:hypothetical protein F5890DRAFT_1392937, partial [Lentinula detonsa]
FGDPLAECLEFALSQSTPFPGELVSDEDVQSITRFVAYHISDYTHLILDLVYDNLETQIPTSLLTNPDFEPGTWYARKLLDQGIVTTFDKITSRRMGDAQATRVNQILNGAFQYPGDNLPDFHPRQNEY